MRAVWLIAAIASVLGAATVSAALQCHLLQLRWVCWEPNAVSEWDCTVRQNQTVAPGVQWVQRECTLVGPTPWNTTLDWAVGPLTFNAVEVDVREPTVRLVPSIADPATQYGLAPLPDIARYANGNSTPGLVAGVNGGYFYRLDVNNFFDGVCIGKSAKQAGSPVSPLHPSNGVGDTAVRRGGTDLSMNCADLGFQRPALLAIAPGEPSITVQHTADPVPAGVTDAIAAGPNLLTAGAVAIPADDDNTNDDEHAGNTAVALRRDSASGVVTHVLLVTADGVDDCPMANATCGSNSVQLAFWLKDVASASDALEMDQGGSTTMWVAGQPRDGVVSNTCPGGHAPGFCGGAKDPGGAPRNIFSALMVQSLA